MMSTNIFSYDDTRITFKRSDRSVMINATQMSKPFGKRPNDWLNLPTTTSFLEVLSITRLSGNGDYQAVITQKGGTKGGGGTWMHEDAAIEFARWLDPRFAIWCNDRVKELMTKGITAMPATIDSILSDPDFGIKLLTELKEERLANEFAKQELSKAAKVIDIQGTVIKEYKPKVEYYDSAMQTKNGITTTVIADDLGISAQHLNTILFNNRIQYKSHGVWVLYSQYKGMGYTTKQQTTINTRGGQVTVYNTLWTSKGREFIINTVKHALTKRVLAS